MQTSLRPTGYLVTFFAAIGGILYGYDIGIINGAMLYIKQDIPMTTFQESFIIGAVLGGGALATLLAGFLADRLGRKNLLVAACVIFVLGVLSVVYAQSYTPLLLGRLVQGLGVGIILIIIPMYLTETAPKEKRGRAVSAFQVLLTSGILGANLIAYWFAKLQLGWQDMFLTSLAPAILLGVGMLFMPESPRALSLKGRFDAALASLKRVYSDEQAAAELAEIRQHQEEDKKGRASLKDRRFIVPLCMVIAIACLNQMTGINSILQLSATILKDSGLSSNTAAILGSVWITLMNCGVTIIALLLVDKVGRKVLLSIGTAGVSLSLVLLAVISYVMPTEAMKGELVMGAFLLYILFFAIGPGVIVWLAISELLPTRIRGAGMAVALTLNSVVSTILGNVFLGVADAIGFNGIFLICAGFTAVYFYIACFMMPETRGKTLEEIEESFAKQGSKS